MDPSVIKAMAAFVYLAVLKDAILCYVMYRFYKVSRMDLFTRKIVVQAVESENIVKMKLTSEI